MFVQESVYDAFIAKVVESSRKQKLLHPTGEMISLFFVGQREKERERERERECVCVCASKCVLLCGFPLALLLLLLLLLFENFLVLTLFLLLDILFVGL